MLSHKYKKGFTLIEMMIAIVIGTILISAVSVTYVAQNRSYAVQDSVSEINTQSKISHDLIVNDIKSSGFGTPMDMNVDPINGYTDIITPVDSNVAPDAVTIVGGFRMLGTLQPFGGVGVCPTVVSLGSTTMNVVYTGTAIFNTADMSFISIDGIDFARIIATANGGTTITIDRPLTQDFPVDATCTGRPVYIIEDTTFCVDNNQTLRRIRRNANVAACVGIVNSTDDAIAENIEDFQLAYAVDVNSDNQIDDQNGDGIINGLDYLNAGAIANPADIRAIRVNVLATADRADLNYQGQGNPPALVENRIHAPTNDALRRRWWQTMIKIRNQ